MRTLMNPAVAGLAILRRVRRSGVVAAGKVSRWFIKLPSLLCPGNL
jgi:hypothetical protein